jgi:DNA repair ATPase RecN
MLNNMGKMKELLSVCKTYNEEDKKTVQILINSYKFVKNENNNLKEENKKLKEELDLLKSQLEEK